MIMLTIVLADSKTFKFIEDVNFDFCFVFIHSYKKCRSIAVDFFEGKEGTFSTKIKRYSKETRLFNVIQMNVEVSS